MDFVGSAGSLVGWLCSPWIAAVGYTRKARALHPRGVVYTARVQACRGPGAALGERLAGEALVRCSGALWKHEVSWPEVLGIAIRFGGERTPGPEATDGDQDLLFATVHRAWLVGLAPFLTDASDFLDVEYSAVSPFSVPGLGEGYLSLVPLSTSHASGTRSTKLAKAVRRGGARFVLRARKAWHREWIEIATIDLVAPSTVDAEALRFSPFQNDAGVVPRGYVHALRHGAYAASQWARRHARTLDGDDGTSTHAPSVARRTSSGWRGPRYAEPR